MRYITPFKAAVGLGASGGGTATHWSLTISAVALAILTPLFLWVVGGAIGSTQAEVVARFSNPFSAGITALFLVVGFRHWIQGTGIMIDDYTRGLARTWSLIAAQVVGWAVIAAAIIALARMVLIGIVV